MAEQFEELTKQDFQKIHQALLDVVFTIIENHRLGIIMREGKKGNYKDSASWEHVRGIAFHYWPYFWNNSATSVEFIKEVLKSVESTKP